MPRPTPVPTEAVLKANELNHWCPNGRHWWACGHGRPCRFKWHSREHRVCTQHEIDLMDGKPYRPQASAYQGMPVGEQG